MKGPIAPAALFVASCSGQSDKGYEEPSSPEAAVVPEREAVGALEGKVLVFEFPDGVRSLSGQIHGEGESGPSEYEAIFQRCGTDEVRWSNAISHRTFAIIAASESDSEIVECFKTNTSSHFNVGYALDDPRSYMRMDTSMFTHLENSMKQNVAK